MNKLKIKHRSNMSLDGSSVLSLQVVGKGLFEVLLNSIVDLVILA